MSMDAITNLKAMEIRDRMPDKYATISNWNANATATPVEFLSITGEGYISTVIVTPYGTSSGEAELIIDGVSKKIISGSGATYANGWFTKDWVHIHTDGTAKIICINSGGIPVSLAFSNGFKQNTSPVTAQTLSSASSENILLNVPIIFKTSLVVKSKNCIVIFLGGLKI